MSLFYLCFSPSQALTIFQIGIKIHRAYKMKPLSLSQIILSHKIHKLVWLGKEKRENLPFPSKIRKIILGHRLKIILRTRERYSGW